MEEGKCLPDQKIYLLGGDELETVQEYIKTNQNQGWIQEASIDGDSPIVCQKKRMAV